MNRHLVTMRVFNKDLDLKSIKDIIYQKIEIFGLDEYHGIETSSKFRDVLKNPTLSDLDSDKFILKLPFKKIIQVGSKIYLCYGKINIGIELVKGLPTKIKRSGIEEFVRTMDYLFDIQAWPYNDISSMAGVHLYAKK